MITVCVTTYNGEKYIEQQIRSIMACLSSLDEVIVSDDGSKDSTLEILSLLQGEFANIKIVEGPRRGLIANFSHALSLASGDIVFLSDQDDVWHSDKVSKVTAAFGSGNFGVVVHNARLVDSDCNPMGESLYDLRQSKAGLLKNLMKNSYVGCCMAIRRDLLSAALPIPENIEMHDWWIGLVSESLSKTKFIDDVLLEYRRHGSNSSSMEHYPLPKMVSNRVVIACELVKRIYSYKRGAAR